MITDHDTWHITHDWACGIDTCAAIPLALKTIISYIVFKLVKVLPKFLDPKNNKDAPNTQNPASPAPIVNFFGAFVDFLSTFLGLFICLLLDRYFLLQHELLRNQQKWG